MLYLKGSFNEPGRFFEFISAYAPWMENVLLCQTSRPPPAITRKKCTYWEPAERKKYLKILLVVLFAAVAAVGYFAITSGVLAEENPALQEHLITRINNERLAHNLPPVLIDNSLANQAERSSQEFRVSQLAYTSWTGLNAGQGADAFIYPKISWAVSSIGLESPLFDSWVTGNADFADDIMNRDYTRIGIGISSDGYNYYIVTQWQ